MTEVVDILASNYVTKGLKVILLINRGECRLMVVSLTLTAAGNLLSMFNTIRCIFLTLPSSHHLVLRYFIHSTDISYSLPVTLATARHSIR